MQGVDFSCIEVNMPREGRYSLLTTKFLPLVLLLIFNPVLGLWLSPLVSSLLMVGSGGVITHLHDIISLGQVGGQLTIVGQSPELCLGFMLDSDLSSAFTVPDLPSEAALASRGVLGEAGRQ